LGVRVGIVRWPIARSASGWCGPRLRTEVHALSVCTRRALMPWRAKNPSAPDERGDGRGLLVAVDLGVGQAAVVVDHRVTELPPDALAHLGAVVERSPVTLWPGRVKRARCLVSNAELRRGYQEALLAIYEPAR
jgi:hypothetical protein